MKKMWLVFEKGEEVAQVIAEYADLDFNGHVNSNRYLEWSLNTFDEKFLDTHNLTQIVINYTQEVYWGDNSIIHKQLHENYADLELFNKDQNQTACKIRLQFVPKGQ